MRLFLSADRRQPINLAFIIAHTHSCSNVQDESLLSAGLLIITFNHC